MHLLKSFNDRRTNKQNAKNVAEWKNNKLASQSATGAWSGKTDNNWNTPSPAKAAEVKSGTEVDW